MRNKEEKVEVYINGRKYRYSDSKEFFYDALYLIDIRSRFEVYKANLESCLELVKEFCFLLKDKNSKPVVRKINSILKYFNRYKTKERLLEVYYNLFLYLDGMGLLPGFNVDAPMPKRCGYNPERYSIVLEDLK